MEFFLNFVWMLISILLVVQWTRTGWEKSATQTGRTAIAVILLIVVLLPVISVTDDLIVMPNLLEEHPEHIVRRGDLPLWLESNNGAISFFALAILAWFCIDLGFLFTLFSRIRSRSRVTRLLDGFVQATGIRPPPADAVLAY